MNIMGKRNVFVHNLKEIKESVVLVFSKQVYIFSAISISAFLFFLFIFLTNMPLFLQAWSVGGFALFPKVSLNIINTILSVSGNLALSLMVAVALAGGINISMIAFKFLATRNREINLFSIGGLIGSAFGAGCPACSTSLLSILGVTGGLSILPFKGIEFTFSGLIILLISLYFIAKSISNCEECKIRAN